MDKNTTRDPAFYRDLLETIWTLTEKAHGGDSVSCGIGTTINRKDPDTGDIEEVDVYVKYDATLMVAGYSSSFDDPGAGNEWEFEITDIELDIGHHHTPSDLAAVGGPLTAKEKSDITAWFEHNYQRAAEIADDNYDPSSYYQDD
jgi:hypothetical protein